VNRSSARHIMMDHADWLRKKFVGLRDPAFRSRIASVVKAIAMMTERPMDASDTIDQLKLEASRHKIRIDAQAEELRSKEKYATGLRRLLEEHGIAIPAEIEDRGRDEDDNEEDESRRAEAAGGRKVK
jgi:hypothetical protein